MSSTSSVPSNARVLPIFCPILHEEVSPPQAAWDECTPVLHAFSREAIQEWFKTCIRSNAPSICPLSRQPVLKLTDHHHQKIFMPSFFRERASISNIIAVSSMVATTGLGLTAMSFLCSISNAIIASPIDFGDRNKEMAIIKIMIFSYCAILISWGICMAIICKIFFR